MTRLHLYVGDRLVWRDDFDPAKHPRGQPENAGEFGPGGGGKKEGVAKEIAEKPPVPDHDLYARLQKEGGFTYHPLTHNVPMPGSNAFSVSAFPERETVIANEDVTIASLTAYVAKNKDAFLNKKHYFGAWLDKESGKTYLDTVVVVRDQAEAEQIARDNKQIAIFGFKDMDTIDVMPEERSNRTVTKDSDESGIQFHMMSGEDALDPDNIIALFEKLKGRPATDAERAECEEHCKALKAQNA